MRRRAAALTNFISHSISSLLLSYGFYPIPPFLLSTAAQMEIQHSYRASGRLRLLSRAMEGTIRLVLGGEGIAIFICESRSNRSSSARLVTGPSKTKIGRASVRE